MLVLMLPRVSSRVFGFPVASPCLWGKLQNISFSKVSKQVVMSFCKAGAALCDIPSVESRCVAGAVLFCIVFTRWVAVFVAGAAFWRSLSSFCVAGAAFQSCRSTLHIDSTLHTHPFTLHTPRITFHTLHFTLHILHFTLCTPHFKLHTLHSTLYTLRIALLTPRSTLYTPHFTLHTLHFTLCTLHPTLNT